MSKEANRVDVLALGEALALVDPSEPGPLERVNSFTLRVAGAEVNALIGLARLGHSTAFVSAVGDDPFGRLVRETLRSEGIDDRFVFTGRAPTGVFFKERVDGHGRRVYYYRSGSAASKVRTASALQALAATQPRVVLVSGLTLGIGEPDGLGTAGAALLRAARLEGCVVVFDANLRTGIWHGDRAREEFADIQPSVDYLLAGATELAVLRPGEEPEIAAASLLTEGLKGIVVKYGKRGSVVHTVAATTSIPPQDAPLVDAIGAGDAFAAGLVSGLLRGWPIEDAATLGSSMGAHAVSGTGDWESLPSGDVADELAERSAPRSEHTSKRGAP